MNFTTWTDAYMCFKNVIPPPLQHLQIVPIICSRHRPIGGGRQRSLVPRVPKKLMFEINGKNAIRTRGSADRYSAKSIRNMVLI